MSWCTIESDPGVFTQLVKELGVKDTELEEIYSLDDSTLATLGDVYGMIFLFRFRKSDYESDTRAQIEYSSDSNIFFAKQTVNNACATQALLGILLNNEKIKLGEMLTDFRSFTIALPPDMRGDSIGQNQTIQKVHNSFARPEPFISEGAKAEDGDDVFHFIAYLPIKGKVYEIDGLKKGPICLGECADGDWLKVARPEIQRRMAKLGEGEIHFSLQAMIESREAVARKLIADAETALAAAQGRGDASAVTMAQSIIDSNKQNLADCARKEEKYKKENMRRRHNYIPFIIKLMQHAAKQGKLMPMMEATEKRLKEAAEKKAATEAKKAEDKKAEAKEGDKKA